MAKIYIINCPKCGHQFEILKGLLVNECDLSCIPAERFEETPFTCPKCGLVMSTEDDKFNDHLEMVMMID